MEDVAVSSYFLPIISAERELIGNNKLFLIFSYLSREARTYIGGNKEKRINKSKIYGLGCNFPQYSLFNSMIFHEMNNIGQYKIRDLAFSKWKVQKYNDI